MRVQRVVMGDSEEESWTLLAEDHGPVESVERFLSYLASIDEVAEHGQGLRPQATSMIENWAQDNAASALSALRSGSDAAADLVDCI